MSINSPRQLKGMESAAAVARIARDTLATAVVVGTSPRDLDDLCGSIFHMFGAVLPIFRAGNRVRDLGKRIESSVTSRGFSVIRGLSGHGVGRAIHEEPSVPNYFDKNITSRLKAGPVVAIEPMISSGSGRIVEKPDGWTICTTDRSLTAHFEHTVVVMDGPPLVLTA